MSGGSDTTTTVQGLPEFVAPYAQNYLQRSQQVADMPYQGYSGATVAQLNPYQTGAYNAVAARAAQGSPVTDAASGELQRTLSGGYLNNNPHLQGAIDLASRDVIRNMDVLNARSGSFGNTGIQEATMRSLGDISTRMRADDYAAERNRMQSAIGMAPTIANQDYYDANQLLQAGQGLQQQEQANLTDNYQRWQEAQNYPRQQLNTLGQGLGMNFGSTQSQIGPGANQWAQALGTGLALYGGTRGTTSGGK